jgi:hypothetical protein
MAVTKGRTRPRKQRDTRSPAQRAADERQQSIKTAWAKRHPELAKAERALRRGNAQMRERWKHKNEGTPETHEHASRRCQGALARLYQSGAIDAEQLAAAVEIATVAERIAADVTVKTASLETRVDVTRCGDGGFFERLGQVRREAAYGRWRAQLPQPAPVLEMLVGEPLGFTIVAVRYRMHNRSAKALLIDALDLWPQILGAVCKEIDEKALMAAHARLAA